MPFVKCPICKAMNDRDIVVGFKISNRYYCKECYDIKLAQAIDIDRQKDENKKFADEVCRIFGLKTPGPLIYTQRKRLREEKGYTDEEILDTLWYIYNVKQCKKSAESLGLIPYYYEEAKKHIEKRKVKEKNFLVSAENFRDVQQDGIRKDQVIKETKVAYDFDESILNILKEEE